MEFSSSYSLFLSYSVWQLSVFHNFPYSQGTSCLEDTISIFYLPEKQIIKEIKQIIIFLGKSLDKRNWVWEKEGYMGKELLNSHMYFALGNL